MKTPDEINAMLEEHKKRTTFKTNKKQTPTKPKIENDYVHRKSKINYKTNNEQTHFWNLVP